MGAPDMSSPCSTCHPVHSSALGALLTVSPSVWYSDYRQQAAVWHIDVLADQQLAGLLMWIPAVTIFIVLGLTLFAAWLGEAERRVALGGTDALTRMRSVRGGSVRE